MSAVPKIPDSTRNSLHWRLAARARERWPQLADVRMRYRAGFAYIDGVLADGEVLQLCRLRFLSSATVWGFAIYRASHDDYEDNVLPSGSPTGTAEAEVKALAGALPAEHGVPLSRWSAAELAAEAVARGVVQAISPSTVAR